MTLPTSTPDAVLRVENLHVHFSVKHADGTRKNLRAVDGVNLSLQAGETLGLVGETGCGKSTLVRAILCLEKPTSGRVLLHGEDLTAMGSRALRRRRSKLQVVFQDPYSSLNPRMTVHDIVAEPLRIHRCYSAARVRQLLEYVGLTSTVCERRPAEFSGGQRQRISIARALALEPDLLILDEPLSSLDVSVQAQVLNVLTRLRAELGLTYLFIAHDLSVVRHLSHRVAVMYRGRIVELGTRDEVFQCSRHPYTQLLLRAVPVASPEGREERWQRRAIAVPDLQNGLTDSGGCPFRSRCCRAQPRCAEDTPNLADGADREHGSACWFPGRGEEHDC